MSPFAYSAFVDISWRASTSDGLQYSGFKTLRYTPSDSSVLPKMLTKTLYEKDLYSNFLGYHFVQIKTENSDTNHLEKICEEKCKLVSQHNCLLMKF